jgi:tRNA-2-methylthio-N6-dimethylallyladenosine synthase
VIEQDAAMTDRLDGLRFFIKTFGCQMNENDSEHIAGILAGAGAAKVETAEAGDVIIVNTCAVREKSEEKLFSYLGRLSALKKRRPVLIGVAGCVAQAHREKLFARSPSIDLVVGPDNYAEIPALLTGTGVRGRLRTGWGREWREIGHAQTLRESRISAYVPIMEGCDNFCTYCIVPFTRGREKYRPLGNIIREIRELAEADFKEVQLLGQNVDSYRDPGSDRGFSDLLDEACSVPGISWVRFLTSHPRDFGEPVIAAMARNPKICRQLHLPLQSGSTAVLERMNRGYGRDDYLHLVDALKAALPGIALSTDIIVGFPGETEEDFDATCDLLREVRFASIFSFRYSPRPHTAAARLEDDVPLSVKRRRLIRLQGLQKQIQIEIHASFIGRRIKVLCLGPSIKGGGRFSGRAEGAQVVNFTSPRDVIGQFVEVLVTGAGPYSLHGELA